MTPYRPTEADLRQLGFRTRQECQPFLTRQYTAKLPSGNWLVLVPKPGFNCATEYTAKGKLVARHHIATADNLQQSLAGWGHREAMSGP